MKDKYKELSYLIVNEERWCGKPVYMIYQYYSELFIQICSYFKSSILDVQIKKLNNIEKQIKRLDEEIKDLSDNNKMIVDFINSESKESLVY